MKGKTVAVLESRLRDRVADLVRRHGATPFIAPALAEIPDVDPTHIRALIDDWKASPPHLFIFQTGVGTRALFAATDALALTDELLRLLEGAQIVVRGPKPTAVLRARRVRIDAAASDPFTTHEVLAELAGTPLAGMRVVVQRYGETNLELTSALADARAEVIEIKTYRWGLPDDTQPLVELIDALERAKIDLVAFTSASQVANLFTVAQRDGREIALKNGLARTLVGSIGPVCSAALQRQSVRVDVEAQPPKLGPFIAAIDRALGGGGAPPR